MSTNALRALRAFETFYTTPLAVTLDRHTHIDSSELVTILFHSVVGSVPAYRNFLAQHAIDPASINTLDDFKKLPFTSKENYINNYPLAELYRDGKLEHCDMIAVSSGSTGQLTFWPRFVSDELDIATRFEQIFRNAFHAAEQRTLAVICFALGSWVGGLYTLACCRHLAAKGYPITSIAPGNNREEIFRVIQALAPSFEQTVLLGYPPFLKEVIDNGNARGIPWGEYKIKLVMAGEVFSEEWRSLVCERAGSKNPCHDTASLYGTADAGVLGNETPLSIAIRQFLARNPAAARTLFGESRLPTLLQYDPCSRFFEVQDGRLLFSGDNGIPLLRYDILDKGGVITYLEMLTFLAEWNFDPSAAAEIGSHSPLPFVYVFGRSNFTVSYFGANIYPENISVALEQAPVCEWVTGKFVLQITEDAERNPVFSVTVELAPGKVADTEKQQIVAQSIVTHLLRLNSEFANYVPAEYRLPSVRLADYADADYFPPGVKHRYTRA